MVPIPIRPPDEIIFGKAETVSTPNIVKAFEVMGLGEVGPVGTGTHILQEMLDDLNTSFNRLTSPSLTGSTTTCDMVFMNIGRLARMKELNGHVLASYLESLHNELAKNSVGGDPGTHAINHKYENLWFVVGAGLVEYIGEWYTTHYVEQNDMIAGMWITLVFIVTLWNWHCMSMQTLIRSIGKFDSSSGVTRGIFRAFDLENEQTWGSIIVEQANDDAFPLFDITTDLLDSELLHGMDIPWCPTSERIGRLFGTTRWIWRYMRWIEVQPLYFIWNPMGVGTQGAMYTDWADQLYLLNDDGTNKYRTFNEGLVKFVERMCRWYFKNSAFATAKALFKIIPWDAVPTWPSQNMGGLLWFQTAHFEDGGVSQDDMYSKFSLETEMTQLHVRRTFHADLVFEIIGDVDLNDFLTVLAGQVTGVNAVSFNSVPLWIPRSYFGFIITKDEYEPYKMDNVIRDGIAAGTETGAFGNTAVVQPKTWVLDATDDWSVGITHNKEAYFEMRGEDPFKKLKHMTYDINNLDIDNMIKIARNIFFPNVKSVEEKGPKVISVSAAPVPEKLDTAAAATPIKEEPLATSAKIDKTKEAK